MQKDCFGLFSSRSVAMSTCLPAINCPLTVSGASLCTRTRSNSGRKFLNADCKKYKHNDGSQVAQQVQWAVCSKRTEHGRQQLTIVDLASDLNTWFEVMRSSAQVSISGTFVHVARAHQELRSCITSGTFDHVEHIAACKISRLDLITVARYVCAAKLIF